MFNRLTLQMRLSTSCSGESLSVSYGRKLSAQVGGFTKYELAYGSWLLATEEDLSLFPSDERVTPSVASWLKRIA